MTTLLTPSTLTEKMLGAYRRDGYVVISRLFAPDEIAILRAAAERDLPDAQILTKQDQDGNKVSLKMWGHAGDDIYGMFSRNERVVNAAERVIGDEIYLYSAKMILKDAREGGAWEWHQDYGYWYKNEFLFPDQMISVMVAITAATKENGCLQVIGGSHKMGRIEHGFAGDQVGAAQHYVDLALKTMPLVYVELKPGDALFFHSNLLHRSAANLSDTARWSLISCYNRQANIGYNEPNGSHTVPVSVVPDEALLQWTTGGVKESSGFLEKDKDEALK
jgi:phytanoyl-CoA hydroxylase